MLAGEAPVGAADLVHARVARHAENPVVISLRRLDPHRSSALSRRCQCARPPWRLLAASAPRVLAGAGPTGVEAERFAVAATYDCDLVAPRFGVADRPPQPFDQTFAKMRGVQVVWDDPF
jgi:hypothetical protein